jgi:hypothetical protein
MLPGVFYTMLRAAAALWLAVSGLTFSEVGPQVLSRADLRHEVERILPCSTGPVIDAVGQRIVAVYYGQLVDAVNAPRASLLDITENPNGGGLVGLFSIPIDRTCGTMSAP